MQPAREGRPLVMGVLNVTPDSFSDGGRYLEPEAALSKGREMLAQGADVIDVGGESTRPGASHVAGNEELRRVLPVVEELAAAGRVSIDTTKPEVARAAVAAGATLVNDISGTLAPVAAELGVGWVAMHMQGEPADMQRAPAYEHVVAEVYGEVLGRAEAARAHGAAEVWVDPGIGFGKTAAHNTLLIGHINELVEAAAAFGHRVLIGTSRKSFLGTLAAGPGAKPLPVDERLEGSIATAAWSMIQGVGMVRVHDVAETVELATLAGAQ